MRIKFWIKKNKNIQNMDIRKWRVNSHGVIVNEVHLQTIEEGFIYYTNECNVIM